MNKPKGKVVFEMVARDPSYLSDKYIKELRTDIPFDMELVSSTSKKVEVHRFVVMMFSAYIRKLFKDGGNSYKNGHVIIPVNVPFSILEKIIELFYYCQTTIPAGMVSGMATALHILQVENVKEIMGPMAPPIIMPNPGARSMPVNVQATPQFNRRATMAYIQPINDVKRSRPNMVATSQQMARPFVTPAKIQSSTFEQVRANPVRQQTGFKQPVPAARNMGSVPNTHVDNGSAFAPVSDHGKNKLSNESNKSLIDKMELPDEGDTNKENERPELNLDIDISNDKTFQNMMADLENDIDLNY